MNIIHNTTRISRRHFLKGAGVAMALPLLDGMVPVRAADEKALRPRRSIFISLPDGVHVRALVRDPQQFLVIRRRCQEEIDETRACNLDP